MIFPSIPTRWHVVKSEEGSCSIWPDYRRDGLPAGWVLTGFSGEREECLRAITSLSGAASGEPRNRQGNDGARPNPPHAARARAASRPTAVPFPRAAAPGRLIVFPHAGSGASYYHFLARACKDDPAELHLVQYPGREMRVKEAPLVTMEAMTRALRDELGPLLAEKPYAFFGHSMGALVAFELTRSLAAERAALPRHLFLSGRQPPHIPGPVLHVDSLDDAAFLEAVGRRYQALPPELLANREILDIVLPSLRADFALMERYTYREAPALDVPVTLLNGDEDPWIVAERLGEWQAHTRHPIRQQRFTGGHFYLPAAASRLRTLLLEPMAAWV